MIRQTNYRNAVESPRGARVSKIALTPAGVARAALVVIANAAKFNPGASVVRRLASTL